MRYVYYTITITLLFVLFAFSRGVIMLPDATHASGSADAFTIEEYVNGTWTFVASDSFPGRPYPDRYTSRTFELPTPSDRVRITHGGGTQVAHIDEVVLDGAAPASAKDLSDNSQLSTKKFAAADYDVVDGWKHTIELSWKSKGSSLSVAGVAEDYKGVPYRWPEQGYLNYTIGKSNTYTFAEIPVSSHPFATRYAYFSSDKKNLIVKVDWTSDNTLDKSGDWIELGVVTKGGLKTFFLDNSKTEWGTSAFTYTDKVSWQHKVYTFSVPLSEIGASYGKSIAFQIRYYGTDGGGGGGSGGDGGGSGAGDPGSAAGSDAASPGPAGSDASNSSPSSPAPAGNDAGAPAGAPGGTSGDAPSSGGTPPPPVVVPTCILSTFPDTINRGERTALAWGFGPDITSLTIDNGIGVVTTRSFTFITPNVTTTFTAVGTGPGGVATCSATVTVIQPPPPPPGAPTCTLTAAPASVSAGSSSLLSWTTTNATSFSINNAVGAVTPVAAGSASVTPAATSIYTGTATGPGGSVTCAATVTVTPPPPPGAPTCTLTANPTTVAQGAATSLTWATTNANSFSIDQGVGAVTPVSGGSVASTAVNAATTFTGTATNASGQTATCTAAVTITTGGGAGGPTCSLSVNPANIGQGLSSTLSWGGTQIQSVFIDNGIGTTTTLTGSQLVSPAIGTTVFNGTFTATSGQILTCSATLTVAATSGGAGGGPSGGGGGGGGIISPTVTLAVLPHVSLQPLAYLYLSQIPYTGLDLGPVGTALYWLALGLFALAAAYLVLFGAAPVVNRSLRNFGSRVSAVLNARETAYRPRLVPAPAQVDHSRAATAETTRETHSHSKYDGFKSFAHNGALSIDDIVKSLSRERHQTPAVPVPAAANTQGNATSPQANHVGGTYPMHGGFEKISVNAEPAHAIESAVHQETIAAPASIRGFASALLEGDRVAVFAGLRQHLRGGGSAEVLLTEAACLLDDVYRARVDGTSCDADVARLSARFPTPILEKLVASLATGIDSSYSSGVTGAKLALTRALATLGA